MEEKYTLQEFIDTVTRSIGYGLTQADRDRPLNSEQDIDVLIMQFLSCIAVFTPMDKATFAVHIGSLAEHGYAMRANVKIPGILL